MPKKKIIAEELPMEKEAIPCPLHKAIHDFMMPYSEYIILERSLPRVEDGLKPVQRRILYTMHELKMNPDGPFKKSARVVGDCLGKYHPHGDTSIYNAMVIMAQDFNMRNTLINGHGNFGSVDGDGAAAMRYTEVKLQPLACELLRDLEKDTVKWVKNFDDSLMEPDLLPGHFPNLMVNGCKGISIGYATNIPTHNFTEICDGAIAYIDNPKIKLADMLKIVKGPDFSTGGIVIPRDSLEKIYETGLGKIYVRARAEIENSGSGKQSIVITEIPYGVNKSAMQRKIVALRDATVEALKKSEKKVKDACLAGIQDIVDESDRNGIRVVIRIKKGEDAIKILNTLYVKTDMQTTIAYNMVGIADGKPQQIGLLDYFNYYVKHQQTIVLKRSQFDLNNAKKREHILDGFVLILPDIDTVVQLIKTSGSRGEARDKLREHFGLSEKQADAILDLKLVNITRLEVTKIEKELREIKQLIARLERIVSSKTEQLKVVKAELTEIRNKYPSKRQTVIVNSAEDVEHKPFEITAEGKRGYVAIDMNGNVKFLSPRQYSIADRNNPAAQNETVKDLCYVDKTEQVIVFGSLGNCYRLDLNKMKETGWKEKGERLVEIFPEACGERAVSLIRIKESMKDSLIYIVTKNGMVKRSALSDYIVNKDVYQGMVLKEGDEVIYAAIVKSNCNLVTVSDDGLCLNTPEDEFPVQGRKAGGVIGMSLGDGASVFWTGQIEKEYDDISESDVIIGELVLISNGYAKRVICGNIEQSKRARKGVKVIDLPSKKLIFAGAVTVEANIALVDKSGDMTLVSSESILVDRNRVGKGKPFVMAADCVAGVLQISDCEQ